MTPTPSPFGIARAIQLSVSPRGQSRSREIKNEKDTGKKGIEAEHREAVEGEPGHTVDYAPKAPNSVNKFCS